MDSNDLKSATLLDGLSDEELASAAEHFTEVHVRGGDDITTENEHGATFFIVLDGGVRVKVDDEAVADLSPGDHFGEVSLVSGERRNATCRAIGATRLAKMVSWDFADLLERNPALAERIKASAENRG